MNWLLVIVLCLAVSLLLVWGMLRPERVYEFPFLTGVITVSFILPQVPGPC